MRQKKQKQHSLIDKMNKQKFNKSLENTPTKKIQEDLNLKHA